MTTPTPGPFSDPLPLYIMCKCGKLIREHTIGEMRDCLIRYIKEYGGK